MAGWGEYGLLNDMYCRVKGFLLAWDHLHGKVSFEIWRVSIGHPLFGTGCLVGMGWAPAGFWSAGVAQVGAAATSNNHCGGDESISRALGAATAGYKMQAYIDSESSEMDLSARIFV